MIKSVRTGANKGQPILHNQNTLLAIIKGIIVGLVISLVLLLASVLVLNFTSLTEAAVPYIAFAVGLIGVLVGSGYVGRQVGSKGWLNGGITGTVFVMVLLILGFVFLDNLTLGLHIIPKLFLGFAFGAVGGMMGVNA